MPVFNFCYILVTDFIFAHRLAFYILFLFFKDFCFGTFCLYWKVIGKEADRKQGERDGYDMPDLNYGYVHAQ